MNRKIPITIVILAAALTTSSCVSTGEYKKMQTAKDGEIAALQQQKTSLEQDNAALRQHYTVTQQQVGSLEQQKTALLDASQKRQMRYQALEQRLSQQVKKGQLQVRQYQNMLAVELAEQIFFDSGRAALKKDGKEVLKKVAEALQGTENKIIRVVGHTDNVPLAKSLQGTYPTNWELSVARATNVVRFLQEAGIPPEHLVVTGRGEYDPVSTNNTAEGRKKNRRIEILLIDHRLEDEMSRQSK